MELVKVKPEFYSKCTENGTDSELLFNEVGNIMENTVYKHKIIEFKQNLCSKMH